MWSEPHKGNMRLQPNMQPCLLQFKRYKLVSVLNAGDELDSLAEAPQEDAAVNVTITSDLLATFRAAAISVYGANSDTIIQS